MAHMVILIVSCTNIMVALGNLSFIAPIGMDVYISPLKFQRDSIYILVFKTKNLNLKRSRD